MLYFNLTPIFKARQIDKPYSFLVKNGVARHTAHRLLSSEIQEMRLKHIELLCKILYCEPNELLAYKPNNEEKLPETHPLNKLIPTQDETNWQEQLKTLPISKLKEIGKLINQSNNENP